MESSCCTVVSRKDLIEHLARSNTTTDDHHQNVKKAKQWLKDSWHRQRQNYNKSISEKERSRKNNDDNVWKSKKQQKKNRRMNFRLKLYVCMSIEQYWSILVCTTAQITTRCAPNNSTRRVNIYGFIALLTPRIADGHKTKSKKKYWNEKNAYNFRLQECKVNVLSTYTVLCYYILMFFLIFFFIWS